MPHTDHLWKLVLAWEEARAAGRTVTTEELCRECPEQEAGLKERVADLDSIRQRATIGPTVAPGNADATVTYVGAGSDKESPDGLGLKIPGYEIVGRLGEGGMGTVYQARQRELDRLVALKVLLGGAAAGRDQRIRFAAEAKVVAGFRHPNIVSVFETGEHEGLPYFSMEYVRAGTLAHRLAAGPLPPEVAAGLLVQVADAVEHAHSRGVIHRDLKPANVLITDDGVPKVSDFGLAKQLDSADGPTRTNAVLGTPSYMAPEQAAGKKEIGRPADVYALGAILYHTLTGRPPFHAATPMETIRQVVDSDPVPVRDLQPVVPRDLAVVCEKCLQKEPDRRYLSAADLAGDLRRCLAGEPIRARPVGPLERGWKWARRHRTISASGLAVAIALIVATVVSAAYASRARAAADRESDARAELEVQKLNALTYIKFILDRTAPGEESRKILLNDFLTAHPGVSREEWRLAFTWTPPPEGTELYYRVVTVAGYRPSTAKGMPGALARAPEAGFIVAQTFNPNMFGD